jgi:hypothetical protein
MYLIAALRAAPLPRLPGRFLGFRFAGFRSAQPLKPRFVRLLHGALGVDTAR